MDSQTLSEAKKSYYDTMGNASEHDHWKATMHLEQVANQCIQAGVCLDDIYIRLMLTKKGQGRVPTPMPVRNRPIETVGDLRAAIAELPDDMRLIKTPEFRRVTEQLGLMCRRQAGG